MDRIFQVVAVVFGAAAAYFLWSANGDGAFVSAVLAAAAFFVSVRFQAKERLKAHEAEGAARVRDPEEETVESDIVE
jgi:hypothetical protein